MLLVRRIAEKKVKLMIILGQVRLSKCKLCPAGARNMKNHPLKLFSIILDSALNQEVHLIRIKI